MKKTTAWVLGFFLLLGAYGFWYVGTYSMGIAEAYEVNEHVTEKQLLIVTQQSNYKDSVTAGIVAGLAGLPVHIKVIDLVSAASTPLPQSLDACVLLHTWEMWRPPGMVKVFQDALPTEVPLFVISTSGSGEEFLDRDLDGISSASVLMDTKQDILIAVNWAKLALGLVTDAPHAPADEPTITQKN